jgi:hypothetical protein
VIAEHGEVDEATAADLAAFAWGIGSEEGEFAVGAEDVGCSHAADALEATAALGIGSGVVSGEVIDGCVDAAFDEVIPESGSLAEEFGVAAGEGELPFTEGDAPGVFGRDGFGGGEMGAEGQGGMGGIGIAMNEIEDLVETGVGAADDTGEGDGGMRRGGGAEAIEGTGLGKFREVRQLSEAHEVFDDGGVHAIEGDDEDFAVGSEVFPTIIAAGCGGDGGAGGGGGDPGEISAVHRRDFPSMNEGGSTPNSSSAVGARSTMFACSLPGRLRFEKRIPGTRWGWMQ